MNGEVVSLTEFREYGLTDRQREVLRRVQGGAECGLCGDLGAVTETDEPVPCIGCGRLADMSAVHP